MSSYLRARRSPSRERAGGTRLLVLGAALAMATACGSTNRSGPPPPTTSSATGGADLFCDEAERFVGRLGSISTAQARTGQDGNIAALWQELAAFLRNAAEVAPQEIRADAARASAVVTEYSAALAQAEAAGGVPPPAAAKLNEPEFLTATARLAEFSRESCGLS